MKIFDWIREQIILSFRVGLNNAVTRLVVTPLPLVLTVFLYLHFRDSLHEHGALIIGAPMVLALILTLLFVLPHRNDPHWEIYYLFHLSKISKIIILIGILFSIGLYFFAQCQQYGLSVGSQCFGMIFHLSL